MAKPALLLLPTLLLLAAPGALRAESVRFDEMPAMDDPDAFLSDEYGHLGLHFVLAGATWSGLSDGDPGGWGLEGTNGPTFLGIDAPVFNFVMRFDWPVAALGFDVARGAEGRSAQLLVFGYRGGSFVEMVSAPLPEAVDDWIRLELQEEVDVVVAIGMGSVPYGVDDLRWSGPLGDDEGEREVVIDIRPDSDENPIQVESRGVVPVLLYGADDFDVAEVDAATLRFGPGGSAPKHAEGPHPGDFDGDGWMDLLMHMPVAESEIGADAVEACLEGETRDGGLWFGCDHVRPVGKAAKSGKAKKR